MKRVVSISLLVSLLLILAGLADVVAEPPDREKASNSPAAGKSAVRVHVFNKEGKLVGPIESPKVVLSVVDWKRRLTADQFKILRSKGTEQPFCGTLLDNKKEGVYTCAGCGLPLFSSDSKFHSGTGWPSFFQPIAEGNVTERTDRSHGSVRTEINCARCGGHLGHVFEDGPPPTGLRFCLNSESLTFTLSDKLSTLADPIAEKFAEHSAAENETPADRQKKIRSSKPEKR